MNQTNKQDHQSKSSDSIVRINPKLLTKLSATEYLDDYSTIKPKKFNKKLRDLLDKFIQAASHPMVVKSASNIGKSRMIKIMESFSNKIVHTGPSKFKEELK